MEMEPATPAETATLVFHIARWQERPWEEQAVCLAVLRGRSFVPEIAKYLDVSEAWVERKVAGLLGQGLMSDGGKLMLH